MNNASQCIAAHRSHALCGKFIKYIIYEKRKRFKQTLAHQLEIHINGMGKCVMCIRMLDRMYAHCNRQHRIISFRI